MMMIQRGVVTAVLAETPAWPTVNGTQPRGALLQGMAPAAAATVQAGACGAMAVLDRDAPKPGRAAASLVAGDPPRPPGGNASDAEDWEDAVGSESSEDEPEAGGMQFELQDIMQQGGTWVLGCLGRNRLVCLLPG